MITKAVLLRRASDEHLLPTTVEKDYALGWILYGISRHPTASNWLFKGGTCLKKCFFETYRFSEDLDFTVPLDEPYEHDSIHSALQDITQWVESEAGISFPRDRIALDEYVNSRGSTSFQGKVYFEGPLHLNRHSLQRVKFDLMQDEVVVDDPAFRDVHHLYHDRLSPAPQVLCYSINEIIAEKSRALYEREGRARDVYDVVHISRAFRESVSPMIVAKAVRAKFEFRGLPVPSVNTIVGRVDEDILRSNWNEQLAHQLPMLPEVDGFVEALTEALSWWLVQEQPASALSAVPGSPGELTSRREAFPRETPARVPHLDSITYAARNRLCLQVSYHGVSRLVEPYSLRHPRTGNTLLYVWERQRAGVRTEHTKAYKLAEIRGVTVTSQSFVPRFVVEL